jgi:cytochrome c-type biogenesis protein CcmH/NrfF
MESLLWAIDLGAVVYLCLWALRAEKRREKETQEQAAAARKEGSHA